MALLEREAELDRLAALVEGAESGEGSVALIFGGAGMGKTSVAREFVRRVAARAHVLWGACDDLVTARPWGPVRDMACDDAVIAQALSTGEPERVLAALRERLSRTPRPTVAVFEDVHWSDGATRDLLTCLCRRLTSTRGVLVLTFRDGGRDGRSLRRLLDGLPHGRVANLALAPLSHGAVRGLAGDEQRAERIWAITGGNPHFVTELLRERDDHVPVAVTNLVAAQVARLTHDAEQLASLASLSPGGLPLQLLEAAAPELRAVLEEVVEERLLDVTGHAVRFTHELVRTAVEGLLAEPRRRELHGRLLRAGEAVGVDATRSAHHARLSGDPDAMVRLLPTAARQAAAARSHPEAWSHLEALVPHLDRFPPHPRADLLTLMASEAEMVNGQGLEWAVGAIELRRDIGEAEGLGLALLQAGRCAWVCGDRPQGLSWTEEAVEVLTPLGGEPLAAAYADLAKLLSHELCDESLRSLAEKALRLAPRPSRPRAQALIVRGGVCAANGDTSGDRDFAEAEQISRQLSLESEWQSARASRVMAVLDEQSVARAQALNAESMDEVEEGTAQWDYHRMLAAYLSVEGGDFAAHERFLRDLARSDHPLGTGPLATLALLHIRQGVADVPLELARLEHTAAGWWQDVVEVVLLWAELQWAHALRDEEITARCLEVLHDPRLGPRDRLNLGLWLWLDGHLDAPPEAGPFAHGPFGLLAQGRWRPSAAGFASQGRPYHQAIALSRGDPDAGVEAVRIADRIGARALAARFRTELRARGVRGVPRRMQGVVGPGHHRLTVRQREVLGLLGEGLTNADVAARLFLSPRTVEKHVAAVIEELGAADRRDAVVRARHEGLLGVGVDGAKTGSSYP